MVSLSLPLRAAVVRLNITQNAQLENCCKDSAYFFVGQLYFSPRYRWAKLSQHHGIPAPNAHFVFTALVEDDERASMFKTIRRR